MKEDNQTQQMVRQIIDTLKKESLTLNEALLLVETGKKKATEMGVPMVIAIVDDGGNLIVQQRMDHALIGSIAISQAKAYTAAVLQSSTDRLAQSILPGQPLYGLADTGGGRFCLFGGGIPLMRNSRCIGGLGVSGGTVDQDVSVAEFMAREFSVI